MSSYVSIDLLNRGFLVNLKDEKTDKNPTGIFLGAVIEEEPMIEEGPVAQDYMIAVPRFRNINLRDTPIVPIDDTITIRPMDEVIGREEELVDESYEQEDCQENHIEVNNRLYDNLIQRLRINGGTQEG